MEGIRWLFFDIGSTLADESGVYADIYRKIAQSAGVSEEQVRQTALGIYMNGGRGDRETARLFGVDFPSWDPSLEVLYDDAKEVLRILSGRYCTGIIANQIPGTEERLEAFGIRRYMDVVAASGEEGVSKPDPELFEIALRKAGCVPEEAVMIGDRLDNDIAPARKLGMKTIWIRQGYGRLRVPESEAPDLEADCLSDLLNIL